MWFEVKIEQPCVKLNVLKKCGKWDEISAKENFMWFKRLVIFYSSCS